MDIKILHILKSYAFSGAENVVITLIRSMREAFPDKYKMVYVSYEGPIRETLKRENILFDPLDSFTIKEIRRVCNKHKPDIVHAHDFTASILCAAIKKDYTLISHLHQSPPWISRICFRTLVYRALLARYDKIVCVSQRIIDSFVFNTLAAATVLPNPVDLDRIKELARESENNIKYDIVFLGRLSQPKNPLRFISIINEIKTLLPELKAAMIGDGELLHDCEQAVKNARLENNITLLGFMDNPYGILSNAGVMCMPSVFEGFPMAVTEAMTLGVPVVASWVGSLPEMIDETCGALCDSDEAFVSAISEILVSGDVRAGKSHMAQERARDMNNLEEYNTLVDEIYCGVYK